MIDGYSVQEAASVLGVAEGRVWELLARGVLLGTPEGDSMRVFFKTQPGPIASAGTHDEPPRTNGNGGSQASTGEASAFRELLTEFRNLTERYGQALLALGESRGEVAGLRSRVDLLEARLDLRLPPPVDAAPMAWDSLSVPASTPEPSPATMPRPTKPRPTKPRPPVRRKARPSKARSSRDAVAGFADALARAQDPNAADLGEARSEVERASEASTDASSVTPDAPEAAIQDAWESTEAATPEVEADERAADELAADELVADEVAADELAADEPATDELAAEVVLADGLAEEASAPEPTVSPEVEAAEDLAAQAPAAVEPSAEVEPPTYSAVVVEPDWFADGDFAWLDAAEREGSGQVPRAAVTPEEAEPEPESAATEPQPEEEPEPQELQLPEATVEPAREPEPEPRPEFEAVTDFEPWQPPAPAAAEDPAPEVHAEPEAADRPEPPTMSTAVAVEEIEEEVMWLGREPEPSPVVSDEPRLEPRAEAHTWPAVDATPAPDVVRPPLAMTEDELARLALDEGWDEAEVAAIRAMITPPMSSKVDLPGAAELHEAMAALEAVPVRADASYDVSRQWTKPAPDDTEPAAHDDWAFEPEPAPPAVPAPPPPATTRPPTDVTSALRRTVSDPGWLRRRGPAAEAYRRLRRLFPG